MTASPESPGARTGERTGERIAKLLARAGVASRREVERMIAEGRVKIGEDMVTTANTVLENLKGVTVDGRAVKANTIVAPGASLRVEVPPAAAAEPVGDASIEVPVVYQDDDILIVVGFAV